VNLVKNDDALKTLLALQQEKYSNEKQKASNSYRHAKVITNLILCCPNQWNVIMVPYFESIMNVKLKLKANWPAFFC